MYKTIVIYINGILLVSVLNHYMTFLKVQGGHPPSTSIFYKTFYIKFVPPTFLNSIAG